jgi:hypothetical protein
VAIRTLRSARSSISDTVSFPQLHKCFALLPFDSVDCFPVMFGLAVVSAFSMVVRFHHSPALHPDSSSHF